MTRTAGSTCGWCSKAFAPRRDGGKPQLFCRPACRRAFDAGGRRWVADAIAGGVLTLDALRNGFATTRALLPVAISPASIDDAALQLAPVAPAESPDEVAELLDDFLIALLDLPGDAWPDLVVALPDELFDRVDRYLEVRSS
jgi:hypothetical protein